MAVDRHAVARLAQSAQQVENQSAGRLGVGLGELQAGRFRPGRRAGQDASTSNTLSPTGVIGGVSRSNSSWIGPTSSSSTFSRVTMPATLPYSSSSIAR